MKARYEIALRDRKEIFEKFPAYYSHLSIEGKPITGKIATTI